MSSHTFPDRATGFMLDCADPGCDVCALAPLPDESHTDWMDRLRERFARQPIPGLPLERPSDEWEAARSAIAAEG